MVIFAAKEFFDCFLQRWSVQESFVLQRLFRVRKFELHGDVVELLDEGRRLFDSLFAFESQAWDIGYPIGTHAWLVVGVEVLPTDNLWEGITITPYFCKAKNVVFSVKNTFCFSKKQKQYF
jgi:hypothetical protein